MLAPAAPASAAVRVIDGDTVELGGVPARLLEIDSPETFRSRCAHEHMLGLAAKARLTELLAGTEVSYQVADHYDRFGRLLARVFADGVDVGAVLLREGYALPYIAGPKAKAARLAVWCPLKEEMRQ
jgi:endonuclease YncB( thermonuclease family)